MVEHVGVVLFSFYALTIIMSNRLLLKIFSLFPLYARLCFAVTVRISIIVVRPRIGTSICA
jgi:hypothetical protein